MSPLIRSGLTPVWPVNSFATHGKTRRGANSMWEFMRLDWFPAADSKLLILVIHLFIYFWLCFPFEFILFCFQTLAHFFLFSSWACCRFHWSVAVFLLSSTIVWSTTHFNCGSDSSANKIRSHILWGGIFIHNGVFFTVSSPFSCIFFSVHLQCLATWVSWNQRYSK